MGAVGAVREPPLQRLDYRIPFKAQRSGKLDLPTLQWHWFDPATGRLEQVQYTPPRPWVLGWAGRTALGIIGGWLLLLGAIRLSRVIKRHMQQWQSQQQVLQTVLKHKAETATVNQALKQCATVHGWPTNLSTQQWLQHWEQRYGVNSDLQATLHQHDAERFGQRQA